MKPEEFCDDCKHHYTFHLMGEGKCQKLYPPRTLAYTKWDNVNSCECKKFLMEEKKYKEINKIINNSIKSIDKRIEELEKLKQEKLKVLAFDQ